MHWITPLLLFFPQCSLHPPTLSSSSVKFLWTWSEGWKDKETPKNRVIPHDSISLGNQPENSRKHFCAPSTEKKRATAAQQTAQEAADPPCVAARSWKKLPINLRKCVETQQLQTHLGKMEINLVEVINDVAKGPALEQRGQGGIQVGQDVLLRMHLPFILASLDPGSTGIRSHG